MCVLLVKCCELVINTAQNEQHKTGIFITSVVFNCTFNGKKCFIVSYIQPLFTVDMYTWNKINNLGVHNFNKAKQYCILNYDVCEKFHIRVPAFIKLTCASTFGRWVSKKAFLNLAMCMCGNSTVEVHSVYAHKN